MTTDHRERLHRALADDSFIQITFSGKISAALPYRRVILRPVLLKGRRHIQISRFDAKQDVTKNVLPEAAPTQVDELLALPFHTIRLQTSAEDVTMQIAPSGKVSVKSTPAAEPRRAELNHDAAKDLPLPPDLPDPFLQAIGIMTGDGRVKAAMQDKFTQINEFLKLLDHTGALGGFDHTPVHILDCGCGSAHLSLAAYHFLTHKKGIPAALTGVDVNGTLIDKDNLLTQQMGLSDVCFYPSAIAAFQPATPPDILLALHACDTATDEALALGVRHAAGIIVSVPCCHKDLHRQLQNREPFNPLLRHGILKQRFADLLTDTFRAQILRLMGYKTDVIEFVSSEHTGRNLMLRAVRRPHRTPAQADLAEYQALKAYWGVTPHLETLLAPEFAALHG
jgi:hypothetical protein